MPGFDRTGPQGMGPMTGGARGMCNPAGVGYGRNYGYGRGMAFGRGFRGGFAPGRGLRSGFGAGGYIPPVADYSLAEADELNVLKAQATNMKRTLDEINRRITELESSSE